MQTEIEQQCPISVWVWRELWSGIFHSFHLDPVPFNIFVNDYKKELEDILFYSINQNIENTLEVIILI